MSASLETEEEYVDPASYRSIWNLGWPVMVNMGAHTLFTLIDLYWIGALGTDAIAAVALCGNVLFSMFGLTIIIQSGALAMISRRIGAGELAGKLGAEGVSAQAFHLSIVLGLVVAISGVMSSRAIMQLFDASAAVTEHGTAYLVPMMIGFLVMFPGMAIGAVFTAAGDTRTPMYVGVAANIVNVVLDPLLIFGWGGFPELGVAGASVASLICQILGLVAMMILYRRRDMGFPHPGLLRWYGADAWARMLRIGIPGGLSALTRPFSTLFLLKVIASFGAEGIAAFGITVRALSLTWLYFGALSTAVSALTGQSLGRHDVAGIRRLVKRSTRMSIALSIGLGAPYMIFAREIIGLFEKENEVVLVLGTSFMQLLVVANLATAFSVIWGAVMSGAGDTRPPMVISILSNWVIKLPLAFLFAIQLAIGVEGIWWAMVISIVFESGALWVWYRRDRWMHAEV
ncbi:MAG: MATE family efflux transporter [bacterium]|nr:MATE family efflux transporter [bacterium]MCP5066937.1 MATE family efflux transporter [bacterium]